jgi:hypothetical protein
MQDGLTLCHPTAADVLAGRITAKQYLACLSPAKATAAALACAQTLMERDGYSLDAAGLTACMVSPNADVASVRAILEGRAGLVERV